MLSGFVLIALTAFPGLPKIPFLLVGGGIAAYAWTDRKRQKVDDTAASSTETGQPALKESIETLFKVEPLGVQLAWVW